jgi:N-acetylglucosaminyl-diphospho-decaprenol L-rhamnosyltransferase
METLAVDVAVVAYRHWELTRSCLEHLQRQTREHRVYVCDNGCDEGTSERVRAEFPAVRVVRLERNMPFGVACNHAVAAGDGDVVLIMNNDVDARPDFVARLAAPLEADPMVGSVAALLVRPGEASIDSVGIVADATLAPFARLQGHDPATAGNGDQLALTAADGAAGAFRRAAWEQAGGIDERLPHHQDFELGVRIRSAGWGVALARDAVAVHFRSATRSNVSARGRREAGFGRAYILRRYGVLRSRRAARALLTEAIVVGADLAISRDFAALQGRVAGWRAAGGLPRLHPPCDGVDERISLAGSLRMRRSVYERKATL